MCESDKGDGAIGSVYRAAAGPDASYSTKIIHPDTREQKPIFVYNWSPLMTCTCSCIYEQIICKQTLCLFMSLLGRQLKIYFLIFGLLRMFSQPRLVFEFHCLHLIWLALVSCCNLMTILNKLHGTAMYCCNYQCGLHLRVSDSNKLKDPPSHLMMHHFFGWQLAPLLT